MRQSRAPHPTTTGSVIGCCQFCGYQQRCLVQKFIALNIANGLADGSLAEIE
jgi:hypothetical protein